MKSIVEEEEFSNDRTFSQNALPTSTIDNNLTLNFTKNITLNNDIKENTTIKMIIDSVKKFQIKEKDNFLFNIIFFMKFRVRSLSIVDVGNTF